jgi:hypothetical protein
MRFKQYHREHVRTALALAPWNTWRDLPHTLQRLWKASDFTDKLTTYIRKLLLLFGSFQQEYL